MKPWVANLARMATVAAGCATLTGCFLAPGKFDAAMDLRSDGTFSYRYDGQIQFVGLKQLAEMKNRSSPGFDELQIDRPCYDWVDNDDNAETIRDVPTIKRMPAPQAVQPVGFAPVETEAVVEVPRVPPPMVVARPGTKRVERPCTETEITERKERAEAARKRRVEREERDLRQMKAVFGGVDPSDPDAGRQIAERLSKQAGWKSVVYREDGLFEVSFEIESRIDHDFAFPTMEGFTSVSPFITAYRRNGDTVRIEAPGFASASADQSGPNLPYFLLVAGAFGGKNDLEGLTETLPIEGTFTLTTDGEVLANNTDEGFTAFEGGKRMVWKVDRISGQAPLALIRLR
ncbi:MAG: hypothetical protein H6913_09130 [Altererythrobacter sp.]|nr:hypothetical protein [Altererythrobacter sp.]